MSTPTRRQRLSQRVAGSAEDWEEFRGAARPEALAWFGRQCIRADTLQDCFGWLMGSNASATIVQHQVPQLLRVASRGGVGTDCQI
ncbi:hypothetical protein QMO56_09185 [Roseomonas sp. E05]|uniref:hypothetical protein n=1 Tax=Roseomonas sp. E05 TaxID=3046310 RepID=UPI0024BA29CD|nr:hypothetical protein [Roseomonas sp. E05]MDJ0388286.1 hypothetical protein [Roseomonas sp. E05]